MKLSRILLLCSISTLIGITTPTFAEPVAPTLQTTTNNNIIDQNSPKTPVVELYQALNTIQKSKREKFSQNSILLKAALEKSYDFQTILSNTVGYRYNSFSPEEKTQLLNAFTNYTVARYLSSFADENGTNFQILPDVKNASVGNNKIISTKIGDVQDMASATRINYLVQQTPEGWKIVDVLLNGHISQVAVQHGDFSSTLAKGGTTELIQMLNEKTKSFAKQ